MKQSLNIAVAEDDADVRQYLGEALERLGHRVVIAAPDARTLLEESRNTVLDLVLADIMMPGMDGIELAKALNQESSVPVILISAHINDDLLARARTDPIMAYLTKPVKESDLRAAIALARHRFAEFQSVSKEAADLRQALEDRKSIERSKGIIMKRLHVDEEEAFRRLRRVASNQNRKLIEVARRIFDADEVFHQLDQL